MHSNIRDRRLHVPNLMLARLSMVRCWPHMSLSINLNSIFPLLVTSIAQSIFHSITATNNAVLGMLINTSYFERTCLINDNSELGARSDALPHCMHHETGVTSNNNSLCSSSSLNRVSLLGCKKVGEISIRINAHTKYCEHN